MIFPAFPDGAGDAPAGGGEEEEESIPVYSKCYGQHKMNGLRCGMKGFPT